MYTCITLDVNYHGDCQSYNASKRSPEEIREISFCIEKIDQILFKLVLQKFSKFAAVQIPGSHLPIWQLGNPIVGGWNAQISHRSYPSRKVALSLSPQTCFAQSPLVEEPSHTREHHLRKIRDDVKVEAYMQKAGDCGDISPQIFLDFPQNFRLRTRNQYCTQAIAWGSTI